MYPMAKLCCIVVHYIRSLRFSSKHCHTATVNTFGPLPLDPTTIYIGISIEHSLMVERNPFRTIKISSTGFLPYNDGEEIAQPCFAFVRGERQELSPGDKISPSAFLTARPCGRCKREEAIVARSRSGNVAGICLTMGDFCGGNSEWSCSATGNRTTKVVRTGNSFLSGTIGIGQCHSIDVLLRIRFLMTPNICYSNIYLYSFHLGVSDQRLHSTWSSNPSQLLWKSNRPCSECSSRIFHEELVNGRR